MSIYVDHAATTPLDKSVLSAMLPFMTDRFGNASSAHSFGRVAMYAVDEARAEIASCIGCLPKEIYFTSGGTESDNWALNGVANAYKNKGKHIITTKIEHPAVLETCRYLERNGFVVTYVDVDKNGFVDPLKIRGSITNDTVLVSVMTVNNEVGTLQPISAIGEICKEKGVVFHTDAVQAMNAVRIDVSQWNIDLLSFSAHKFYGPKGVGVLYVRSGVLCDNLHFGGEQERGRRPGTTNTSCIVGCAKALCNATDLRRENTERVRLVCNAFIDKVNKKISGVKINSPINNDFGIVNMTFEGIRSDAILMALDMEGIAASAGSACMAGSVEPSHVLLAMGRSKEDALSSVRFSFGKENTEEDAERVACAIEKAVSKMKRDVSLFKVLPTEGKII